MSPRSASPSRASTVLLAVLCGCADPGGSEVTGPDRPELGPIVVITLDTLRADHLGCYGYFRETSPSIDRFAAESVLFENAVTTIATTLPAHVSLWTSRYPLQTKVTSNDTRFRVPAGAGTPFFAQMLKDLGYVTAAFVSATPVKRESGIAAGFDVFDQPDAQQRPGEETTEKALAWLAAAGERPFFLWIHYFDPHTPYDAPEEFERLFAADEALVALLRERGFPDPERSKVLEAHDAYDAEIRYTDSQVERVLEHLRATEAYARATIVIAGDHGEGLGQHNFWKHGRIFNEQLFVPLIVKFPDAPGRKAERRSDLVSLVDVVPTLVGSLGLSVPAETAARFMGRDATAESFRREFAFAQRTEKEENPRLWGEGVKFCLLGEEWKLHLSSREGNRLFDMLRDRHETVSVLKEHPEVAERMDRAARSMIEGFHGEEAELDVLEDVSPETLEELRKLGYAR